MQKYTSRTLGQLSLTIVIISLFAAVALILFFIGDFNQIEWLIPFGPANDVLSLTIAILTCVMASMLLPPPRKQPVLFIAFLILIAAAWVGAAIVTVFALREGVLMPNNIYYTFRLKYGLAFITDNNGLFGQGLIGLWLTAVNIYAYMKKFWPRSKAILGIVSGLIQSLGLFDLSVGYVGVASQLVWNFLLSRWLLGKSSPSEVTTLS
jgi:hypothetical protein